MKKIFVVIFIIILTPAFCVLANKKTPLFYSTKSSKINMRTGPGYGYPVKFVYLKSHLPLMFIEEFEGWIKIIDLNNDEGWINKNMLSNKRYVITTKLTAGYSKNSESSDIRITLDPMIILELKKCTLDWCFVKLLSHKIWVKKSTIWGVKEHEIGNM